MLKDMGGLDGGSTFKSAGKQEQYLNSVKTAINSETFGEQNVHTAVLDGIMQKHSTRIVRK
jgi:hypothetical protein